MNKKLRSLHLEVNYVADRIESIKRELEDCTKREFPILKIQIAGMEVYKEALDVRISRILSDEGWLEFDENLEEFANTDNESLECLFDDMSSCMYNDIHPKLIMTHFRVIKGESISDSQHEQHD